MNPTGQTRFYPLFGQLSSIAPIIAGQVVARVAEKGDFGASLRILTILTTVCGVGIVGLYKFCSVAVQREADAGCVFIGLAFCMRALDSNAARPQNACIHTNKTGDWTRRW
jgi:ATP/ADP translocase